ncbi:Pex17p TDEL_0A00760 [Torulaspora delbrueckii]|uniref:Uncharacterized protein n=1 Tax=Torulaspora delbrueckii TaxID=4950 RepID=G8ZLB4_TORDE|nr:hypothetical protein TDEL_0A00760 [Torulaspora delbrueckii]CCE89408.1 hypothetical protein TDEL_0A00760 [Torulaspora delbrueckii]
MNIETGIDWPKDDLIVQVHRRRTIGDTIQNLFSNTGIAVSILYILIKKIIEPCLESHFSQRTSLSVSTLIQLRRLVATLQGKLIYTPISSIGFDEEDGKVERSTQTSEDGKLLEARESRWKRLNDCLKEANGNLQSFNTTAIDSSINMDSFQFQMKLVVDGIRLNEDADETSEHCRRIVDSVREVKGLLVNGRFP